MQSLLIYFPIVQLCLMSFKKRHYFSSDAFLQRWLEKGIQRKIPRDCHVTENFAEQNAPIGLNG